MNSLGSDLKRIPLLMHYGRVAGLALFLLTLAQESIAQSGRIERGTLSSAALAGNLFNDPTNRGQTTLLRGVKLSHGTSDSLMPVSQARALRQALRGAGLDPVYEEHAEGHEFLAQRSLTFLSQTLVGAERSILPPALIFSVTGDDAVMRFPTQAGVEYQIEHAASLEAAPAQWTLLETVEGTSQMAKIAMPAHADRAFLRVRASNAAP